MKRHYKINFAISILALILALIFFELYLRIAHHQLWIRSQPGQASVVPGRDAWYEADKDFGWVYNRRKAPEQSDQKNHIGVIYNANEDGFRDRHWSDFKRGQNNGTAKILVFGDSQTAGFGVSEDERFSNVLQSMLSSQYSVYNFAVAGWGFDQMYLAFKKYTPVVNPKIVIIAYIYNDLLRSLEAYRAFEQLEKPSFDLKKDELQLRTQAAHHPIQDLFLSFYSINFFYKTLYKPYLARQMARKIADSMIQDAQEHGFTLIFVKIPVGGIVKPAVDFEDRMARLERAVSSYFFGLGGYLKGKSQIWIDLTQPLRHRMQESGVPLYFPEDSHLNQEGHRLAAEILFDVIRNMRGPATLLTDIEGSRIPPKAAFNHRKIVSEDAAAH